MFSEHITLGPYGQQLLKLFCSWVRQKLGTHVVVVFGVVWLRTNGVNTNGVDAKVMDFDILVPQKSPHKSLCQQFSDPISLLADPFVPFRAAIARQSESNEDWYPTNPSVRKYGICSDPTSVDPTCPFPSSDRQAEPNNKRTKNHATNDNTHY